jgi:hypothetical protein
LRSARGTVDVSSISAAGPLGTAGEWRYEASGRVIDLVLDAVPLPGPATVRRGEFHLLPRIASFSGVEAGLLDAIIRGSAEFRSSGGGVSQATGSLEGEIGEEATGWASSRLQIPPEFLIRAPLSVSAAAFSWERAGPVSFKGEFHRPGGAVLSAFLRQAPEVLAIDSLLLRDPDSDAALALHLGPKDVRLKFKGTLFRSTVEKFATIPARTFQSLKGDLELSVDRESPERSVARGTLEGEGIRIPWEPLDPLLIRSASLSAEEKKIRVVSSDLSWREIPLRLSGEGSFSGEGMEADVDVTAGDVPLERLLPQSAGSAETASGPGRPATEGAGYRLPKLPVRGVIRLRADSIGYGRSVVNSVAARGELGPEALHVVVSGADLCGFLLQGSATLDSGGLALELRTTASGGDLNQSLICLTDKRVAMTGSFQFATRLSARGRDKESLLRSIEGPVEFSARDGRIEQWTAMSRILSLLNVTNVIGGQFPDLRQEGLPYKTLRLQGEFSTRVLLVKEGTLSGPTLGLAWTGEVDLGNSEMDIKVLAAPFRTADWIIRKIPFVGYIMGKTLVSVPLTVKGDFHDPSVSFDPGGAGVGLLGVLERTVALPVKVVGDILPESKPPK